MMWPTTADACVGEAPGGGKPMAQYLAADERAGIEHPIRSFDNHGRGNGFDIRA